MINSRFFSSLAPLITLIVIALGAWMWVLEPQSSIRWAVGIGFLPTAWIGILLLQRIKACRRVIEGGKFSLMSGISLAGLMLGGAYGLKISQHHHLIDESSPDRLVAILLGAFMVIMGNALPKKLEPLDETKCVPTQGQAFKRFAGWMFVFAGFGYALVWLILPERLADVLAFPILAAPILIVMARMMILRLGTSKKQG